MNNLILTAIGILTLAGWGTALRYWRLYRMTAAALERTSKWYYCAQVDDSGKVKEWSSTADPQLTNRCDRKGLVSLKAIKG